MTNIYKAKSLIIPGSNFREVYKVAQITFKKIKHRTKRKPYVRSAYFYKQKVFFDLFWIHLFQKHEKERTRRLKYFTAAIELIKNSRIQPSTKENPNKRSVLLHRFKGKTKNGNVFYVQIKEHKRTERKKKNHRQWKYINFGRGISKEII